MVDKQTLIHLYRSRGGYSKREEAFIRQYYIPGESSIPINNINGGSLWLLP